MLQGCHAFALADHVISTGHNIKWDHFDILIVFILSPVPLFIFVFLKILVTVITVHFWRCML